MYKHIHTPHLLGRECFWLNMNRRGPILQLWVRTPAWMFVRHLPVHVLVCACKMFVCSPLCTHTCVLCYMLAHVPIWAHVCVYLYVRTCMRVNFGRGRGRGRGKRLMVGNLTLSSFIYFLSFPSPSPSLDSFGWGKWSQIQLLPPWQNRGLSCVDTG